MTGYHYTSYSNWQKIQKEGLKPSIYRKREFKDLGVKSIKGVWLWMNKPKGNSHVGEILFRVARKQESKIVLLEVKYKKEFETKNGESLTLYHHGAIGKWTYHENEEAKIAVETIAPRNIKLVKTYDLKRLLK